MVNRILADISPNNSLMCQDVGSSKWLLITHRDPWDWYIYLLIYHQKQLNVGKYTNPMDGMGSEGFFYIYPHLLPCATVPSGASAEDSKALTSKCMEERDHAVATGVPRPRNPRIPPALGPQNHEK